MVELQWLLPFQTWITTEVSKQNTDRQTDRHTHTHLPEMTVLYLMIMPEKICEKTKKAQKFNVLFYIA